MGLYALVVAVLLTGGLPTTLSVGSENTLEFSEHWKANVSSGSFGCHRRDTTRYTWRGAGFGSNINLLSEAWAVGILRGHIDLAVVLEESHVLSSVECLSQSDGIASVGWPCIFRPMPHVCFFGVEEEWKTFLDLREVSKQEQEEAVKTSGVRHTRLQRTVLHDSLQAVGGSLIGALAALADHLMSHLQPWLLDDVDSLLSEPELASFGDRKYIGVHVRRGDKMYAREGQKIETEVYLKNASDFLRDSPSGLSAADITGLWVASDDATVLQDMQRLVPRYFPNIGFKSIIWVSGRTAIRPNVSREPLATHSVDMKYDIFVTLMADLQMLSKADIFIGTFSSNIGRLMVLLREAGEWPRNTTRSVHVEEWFPGRRTRRR